MFSKKKMFAIGLLALLVTQIIALSLTSRKPDSNYPSGSISMTLIGPLQDLATGSVRFVKDVWRHYFHLVGVSKTNDQLARSLNEMADRLTRYKELELENTRLRELLDLREHEKNPILFAEVVGKDASPWFKSLIIDKGKDDGIRKGLPVVTPGGVVGLVVESVNHYSKVLLITDRNCAVDCLIQRSRARGLVKGKSGGRCSLYYVLRKHDVSKGDVVISSGLDGVFPKGLPIGKVTEVGRMQSGIFQDVTMEPFVNFEKIEQVIVILKPLAPWKGKIEDDIGTFLMEQMP